MSEELRRSIPTAERPRERLFRHGVSALSDAEILALILGTGHATLSDSYDLARGLLGRFGDLRAVLSAGNAELAALRGVGSARAAALVAAGEIVRRAASKRLDPGVQVTSSSDVQEHFGPLLADEMREVFYALLLDTKNRLVRKVRISEGSLGASLVHPREAFRPAIREAAASVLFLHNHPSGDPTPSSEDRRVTDRLKRAGELLGIPVLDHVVVGRDRYYSFADSGW